MKRKICVNRWLLFIILFFCVFTTFSQDTLFPAPKQLPVQLSFVRESEAGNLNALAESIDSSLSSFHRTRGFLYDITLERNIFTEEDKKSFRNDVVQFSDDVTLPYKLSHRTIRYYNLNKRFTEITYLLGGKKEQLLNVLYTQNLMKGWSVGLDFRRAGAEGFFQRQQFYQSSFDVFTHYKSTNERYNLFAYYLRNRLEQEENGGIRNFNPDENTVAQPTYLSSAENRQTDKEVLLRQSFRFRKLTTDSMVSQRKPNFSLGHEVRYETRGSAHFDNPADSFYQYNFLDSTNASDSTWYQRWNNEVIIGYGADTSGGLSVSLSGGHEYFIYKYGSPEIYFFSGQKENYYGSASVNWRTKKNYLDGKMYMYFGDYGGDYDFHASYSRVLTILNQQYKVFIQADKGKAHPNISDIRKYSNHFLWFNDFKPVDSETTSAGVEAEFKNERVAYSLLWSIASNKFENMVYYDSTATPRQFPDRIRYDKAKFQMNFAWDHWIWENTVEFFQIDKDAEDIIHLPRFMTGHSLVFEKYFFKSALLGRIGVDVRYVPSYYADRYMPASQEFYLQYTEKTGGYVQADFFITFKVKSSRFFVKMENVLNGMYPEPKFSRPDYPLTPRAIRFGLQLRFYD